jgi:hypothetical protein
MSPLVALEKAAYRKYKKEFDAWALANPQEKKKRGPRSRVTVAGSVEEGAANSAQLPGNADELFPATPALPKEKPKPRRFYLNDATMEAMLVLTADNPRGVIGAYDEIAGLFGSIDAYKTAGAKSSKDRPIILTAKDGRPYKIDRKGADPVHVENWGISFVGGTQVDKIQSLAPNMFVDGLLQRFALVLVTRVGDDQDLPDDKVLDQQMLDVAEHLSEISENRSYRLAPEADAELQAIKAFRDRETDSDDTPKALKEWLSKTPNEFGRICLAFHCIEHATRSWFIGDDPPPLVSRDTAARARRYIEFLYLHQRYFYCHVLGRHTGTPDLQWIGGNILSHTRSTIELRDVNKNHGPLKGARNNPKIIALFKQLVARNWLRYVSGQRWAVNPAVHVCFADIAVQERDQRERRKKAIREYGAVRAAAREQAAAGALESALA